MVILGVNIEDNVSFTFCHPKNMKIVCPSNIPKLIKSFANIKNSKQRKKDLKLCDVNGIFYHQDNNNTWKVGFLHSYQNIYI